MSIEYKDLDKLKYYCKKNNIKIVEIIFQKNVVCILEISKGEKLLKEKQKDINILAYNVLEDKYIRVNIK